VLALDHLSRDGSSFLVNLGTGHGYSVRECITAAQSLYGPFPVKTAARRPGDPPTLIADSAAAKNLLGWEAEYKDIAAIIRTMGPLYGLKEK
jgi:UDP-glucose 4-epimerase